MIKLDKVPIYDKGLIQDPRELRKRRGSITKYELTNHPDLFDWIIERTPHILGKVAGDGISILDFSEDGGIFSTLLAKRFRQRGVQVKKVAVTVRGSVGVTAEAMEVDLIPFSMNCERLKQFGEKFEKLGRYDLIVLKEMLYEVEDFYEAFFEALRRYCVKNDDSHLIIMTVSKECAPVPMPTNALLQWRDLAPSKPKVCSSLSKGGFSIELYGATVEVSVPKADWGDILKSGSIDVVKFARGCDAFAINEFISEKKGKNFEFEEKLLVIFASIRKAGALVG